MNRKGDIVSIFITFIVIMVMGIMLLFFSNTFSGIYQGFDDYFNDSKYNNSEAHQVIQEVQVIENSAWDYVFFAIFMGYVIVLFITSFSTPINAFFFWIYVFLLLFGLVVGTLLSNVWQEFAASPALSATAANFPITNIILGNFFPLMIVIIGVTAMILLFGKSSSGGDR